MLGNSYLIIFQGLIDEFQKLLACFADRYVALHNRFSRKELYRKLFCSSKKTSPLHRRRHLLGQLNDLGEAVAVEDHHQQAHEGISLGWLSQSFREGKEDLGRSRMVLFN